MTTPLPRSIVSPGTSPGAAASKAARFRALLLAPELTFLMEAHDGLSAKIVEEAGFPGIWASGLTVSAALGVRDSNEASWTQVLEVLEFMADATSIPILLDRSTSTRSARWEARARWVSAWPSRRRGRWSSSTATAPRS